MLSRRLDCEWYQSVFLTQSVLLVSPSAKDAYERYNPHHW